MSSSRLIGWAESVKDHWEEDAWVGGWVRGVFSLSLCLPGVPAWWDQWIAFHHEAALTLLLALPSVLSLSSSSFFLSLLPFLSLPGRRAGVWSRSRDTGQSKECGVGRRLPRQGLTSGRGWGGYISGEKLLFSFLSRETQRKEKELVCAPSHKERSCFVLYSSGFPLFFPSRVRGGTTGEFRRGDHHNRVRVSSVPLCLSAMKNLMWHVWVFTCVKKLSCDLLFFPFLLSAVWVASCAFFLSSSHFLAFSVVFYSSNRSLIL